MDGFVKFPRHLYETALFADANLLKQWMWLLGRAAYKRQSVSMKTGRGDAVVTLEPGQCIVGRHAAAKELGVASSTFRDRLKKLESMGMVDTQPDTHWTVVSIANWGEYHGSASDSRHPTRHPSDTQPTQIKKDKTYKKRKSNQSPTGDASKSRSNRTNRDYTDDFVLWWEHYPRKEGKPTAFARYLDAIKRISGERDIGGTEAVAWLKEQTALFAKQKADTEPQFIKHPTTWLNNDGYNDVSEGMRAKPEPTSRAMTIDQLAESLPSLNGVASR